MKKNMNIDIKTYVYTYTHMYLNDNLEICYTCVFICLCNFILPNFLKAKYRALAKFEKEKKETTTKNYT